eukprot:1721-Eustigmatos_ZCMA.PRE.1
MASAALCTSLSSSTVRPVVRLVSSARARRNVNMFRGVAPPRVYCRTSAQQGKLHQSQPSATPAEVAQLHRTVESRPHA